MTRFMKCLAALAVFTTVTGTSMIAAAQEVSTRVIPDGRRGQVDASLAGSPNGGRPEIHTIDDMEIMTGYTAPGARMYARLAVAASNDQWPVTLYYRCKYPPGGTSINAPMPEPMEVFDDVYSIGDDANNIWAIDTEEGIILIDALTTAEDAQNVIVRNMEKVGLDPRRIRQILITHNHLDHFGGMPYLKSLSGAQVGASRIDWEGESAFGSMPQKAFGDYDIADGQEITLGGRTLTAVLTPGHTPGTLSFVFPVTDKGIPHMAALFGGQGKPRDIDTLMTFRHGLDHFADVTDRMQADVVLSNHTVGDDGLTKIAQLAQRQPGEAHPYIVGREGVIGYNALFNACLSADIDQMIWNQNLESEN